jgi:large subunit ribosomal protein L16
MLQPKKTKYRKAHKGRIHGKSTSCNTLDFGSFGLKALEPDRLTARQIEAARRAKKPAEVRMGSGKGSTEYWAARVKPGRVIFEVDGIPRAVAEESLRLAGAKLPIKTRFVARLGEA